MQTKESRIYYRAMLAKDRRFDGRFFVGVHTTRIYCRPICPAKKPLLKNISFYANASAAEEAGFRPCFRCRPESSPGSPAWQGTSASVSRALRLIANGPREQLNIPALCERLGLGERQLRRLFIQHLGASPQTVVRTRRLDFASGLLEETSLPISEIAFASGFESVRRFNDAFKRRFRRTPSQARSFTRRPNRFEEGLKLRLPYRPPFDWISILDFLRKRALPGVETVVDDRYLRTIDLGERPGWIEVSHDPSRSALVLRAPNSPPEALMEIIERVKQLFDLGADPFAITRHLGRDQGLRQAIKRFPGLRVPGAWDGFELGVRAILGQQISVSGARTLAGRLITEFGKPVEGHTPLNFLFPTPRSLSNADVAKIGVPKARGETIRRFAEEIQLGKLRLDGLADPIETRQRLLDLPGFGKWTVAYIMMRALRDPDAFLETDLVIKRQLERRKFDPEKWQPWRAYATLYMWKLAEGK